MTEGSASPGVRRARGRRHGRAAPPAPLRGPAAPGSGMLGAGGWSSSRDAVPHASRGGRLRSPDPEPRRLSALEALRAREARCRSWLPGTTIWRPQPFDHDDEGTMKYLRLVYNEEKKLGAMSKIGLDAFVDEHLAYDEVLRKSGHFIVAEALQPVQAATTVRVRNGKVSTTDGPFAERKEQLGDAHRPSCHRVAACRSGNRLCDSGTTDAATHHGIGETPCGAVAASRRLGCGACQRRRATSIRNDWRPTADCATAYAIATEWAPHPTLRISSPHTVPGA